MKYVKLGNSDLNVSRVCLGCMGFGDAQNGMHRWTLNMDETRPILKQALDGGINFFDTAIAYQNGTSEQYVGRILKELAKREDVVIATKFPGRSPQEIEAGVTGRQHVQTMLDTSLKNLGVDYVDLYICHSWDYSTPIEETMEALNDAVKAGKVRAIGGSNWLAYQLAKANAYADAHGLAKIVSMQGHYNLIFREEEREMAILCKEDNIAMTPYSALASGRLSRHPGETSKRLEQDTFAKGKYDATAGPDGVIIDRVAELAEKYGVTMTEISLSWLLTKVASPVVGATKPHHIDGAVKAVELELTEEERAYLEEPYVPHQLVGAMSNHLNRK